MVFCQKPSKRLKKVELTSPQQNNMSLTCPYERFYSRKTGQNDEKEGNAETGLLRFELIDNQDIKMVDPAGFEPATKGL